MSIKGEKGGGGGMGFKQLKQFNLALLAKQGWRLQMKHDSLVYRVLKAKYFPKCDFINAALGNNPSFTWRSILVAQNLVRFGMRWEIGNGEQVHVWGDKCLPSPTTFQVSLPRLFLHADTRVCELINKEEATWKNVVLDALFMPHEAEVIKSIPLSSRLPSDRQIWALNSNGMFSVRSAYYGALQLYRPDNIGMCLDDNLNWQFWKHLWKLSVPHKIGHFVWRACCDILQRKVTWCVEKFYRIVGVRDVIKKLKLQVTYSKMAFPVETSYCNSFKDLLWSLLMADQPRNELAAKVVTCAWALWHNRNEVRLGEARKTGKVMLQWALQYLEEYYAAMELPQSLSIPVIQGLTSTPPPDPSFKINVDGVTFSELGAVGIRFVARDAQGQVAAALSWKFNAPLGAIEMEAKA